MNLSEKAVSKKQQKFFGLVRAAQKGDLKNPSQEVVDAAVKTFSGFRKAASDAMKKVIKKKKEERKPQKAMDAGARAKRKLARKVYRSTVSDFIPDDIQDDYKIDEAERSWHRGYDSGDKTVPRRKALNRVKYFDNRGENERADKIRSIVISKDYGDDYDARKKAKRIKISDKMGKLPAASKSDKRGAISGDVKKKIAENIKIEDAKGNLAFEVIDIIKPGSLEPTKQIVQWEDPTKNNNVNEKYGDAFDTPKYRERRARQEKANTDKNLQMLHGKSWREFTDAAIKAKENREKENRDYVDRKNRGIVAYSKNWRGKVVKGRIKGGKFKPD